MSAAIEAIYGLFAAPTPDRIEGCPCCIGTRRVDALLTTPLRKLSGDEMWRYVSGAFLTIGDVRDFRYLLPRILEVAICDPSALPNTEIVLGKLKLAGWSSWSPRERKAVEALIDLWVDHAFAGDLSYAEEGGAGWGVEAVLCGAARAGLDLKPWLVRLSTPEAAPIRAHFAEQYAKDFARGSTPNTSFWEDAPEGWRALADCMKAY